MHLTRKSVIGLVYIILGLLAVAGAAAMTYSSGRWFSSANELSVNVIRATFMLNQTVPSVFINASLANPAGFVGLQLLDVNYGAYVNSTSEKFQYLGTTSVGLGNKLYGDFIPSRGNMNISFSLPVYSTIVVQLNDFISRHPSDLFIVIGATLDLSSSFGPLNITYCYELPGQTPTICPPSPQSRGRGPGGG